MCTSVTQWGLLPAGTALGLLRVGAAGVVLAGSEDLFPRALHQHARLGRCRLYFGAKACRICALMYTSVTQWGLRSAGTALGVLRNGAHGSRGAGGRRIFFLGHFTSTPVWVGVACIWERKRAEYAR